MPRPTIAPLATPRLTLRPLRLDDAAFVLRLLNEPSFLEHIGDRGVRDLAGAENYLRTGPLAMYEGLGLGLLLVERRSEGAEPGTAIGICGLLQRDSLPAPDVGFALLQEYWGQGYAHEAATAVIAWGRDQLHLQRILAVVAAGNVASRRLLAKLGLRFTRHVRLTPDAEEICLYES